MRDRGDKDEGADGNGSTKRGGSFLGSFKRRGSTATATAAVGEGSTGVRRKREREMPVARGLERYNTSVVVA
jgi:hypothetical protein